MQKTLAGAASRPERVVDRARRLIEILEPVQILRILHYLVEDYWSHYLGWPDLLLHRNEEIP